MFVHSWNSISLILSWKWVILFVVGHFYALSLTLKTSTLFATEMAINLLNIKHLHKNMMNWYVAGSLQYLSEHFSMLLNICIHSGLLGLVLQRDNSKRKSGRTFYVCVSICQYYNYYNEIEQSAFHFPNILYCHIILLES